MHKGLPKLILTLFCFLVIYQGVCSVPDLPVNHQLSNQAEAQLKIHEFAQPSVRILPTITVVPFITYGAAKPLWVGDIDLHGKGLTVICQTLFLQNTESHIYRVQFLQYLLYPFHFFW